MHTPPMDQDRHEAPISMTPASDQLRATGQWNPAWDALAELDAGYVEKFVGVGVHAMTRGTLDPLTIEFIAIAVDASCTHLYAPGVRRHIRKALELGATRDQIMTVLELVSVLGIHSVALGAPLLIEEAKNFAADGPMKQSY